MDCVAWEGIDFPAVGGDLSRIPWKGLNKSSLTLEYYATLVTHLLRFSFAVS